jgi:hypothetical protein
MASRFEWLEIWMLAIDVAKKLARYQESLTSSRKQEA